MRVDASIFASPGILIEPDAIKQLKDACMIPTVKHVLATPDIHIGYGVPIGSVIATENAIVPAAVGYDINCGMRVIATDMSASDIDTVKIAHAIRRDIPLGEGKRNIPFERRDFLDVLSHGIPALFSVKNRTHPAWSYIDVEKEAVLIQRIEDGGSMTGNPDSISKRAIERGQNQLGTLGGGNHFIELQEIISIMDEATASKWNLFTGQLLVMIHSGSRGFGHQVGDEYMALARSKKYPEPHPNSELCYMPADSNEGIAYIGAMHAGANLAFANRHFLAALVCKNILHYYPGIQLNLLYDVPHNMAKFEEHGGRQLWIHRKGATRAYSADRMKGTQFEKTGQPVLIPGSMGSFSYILAGIPENERALASTNHGAGRSMSRTAAAGKIRRRDGKILKQGIISDESFAKAMEGITLICEDKQTIKEEAPQAYKDIDAVIEAVKGAKLARVIAKMKPLAVLKG